MLLLSQLTRNECRVGVGLLAAGFVVSASTILVSTRAQQLDQPLPSVGPSVLRQYQLVPSVTRHTVNQLQEAHPPGDTRRDLSLWQVNLQQYGGKGLLGGIAGSLILLAALVVVVRRTPIWRNHSPP